MSWDKLKVAGIFSKLQTDFTIKYNLATFFEMVKKLFRLNFKTLVTPTESPILKFYSSRQPWYISRQTENTSWAFWHKCLG